MLGDVYCCASMIDPAPFAERLAAARDAGYQGVGLRPTHYKAARASGLTDGDMRAMLDDHGLKLIELGFIADWWETGGKAARAEMFERSLYAIADALGGEHVVLISGPVTDGVDALADRFGRVCDRAAEHGMRVGLETLPWTDIHDVGIAWEIIARSGHPNGGPIYDAWHLNRGGTTEEMIRRVPPGQVIAIQLNDGSYELVESELEDTFKRRVLPGQGDFRIAQFVALVEQLGVSAPMGVEVLNEELRALSAAQAAKLGIDATREVLAAARHSVSR
jgi:sugar phosphate isomerase/epimerase